MKIDLSEFDMFYSVLTQKELKAIIIYPQNMKMGVDNEKVSFYPLFVIAFCLAHYRSESVDWVSKRTGSKNV